ncbi:MAG TPA: GNAT family N-acetyltransferase [Micromonosporaceae bacterium]|jgi:RimJ/RimL family protein N-acetyltransferase|nr:GNAT family N-acetyltransferase [Micromonosporaceae bacterium]
MDVGTPRLRLRRFTTADVDLLVELNSDPEVMAFLTGGEPTPRARIADEILPEWLAEYERWPHWGHFAAEPRDTGDFIGWFGMRPKGGYPDDVPELGYRLRRSAWGHGYATEGSLALIDAAFGEYGASRVIAETMAVNTRSRGVMERCGLRHVGTRHDHWDDPIPGTEHGEVEYAITRDEWLARKARFLG